MNTSNNAFYDDDDDMAHLFYYDAGRTESNVEVLVRGFKLIDGDFKQTKFEHLDASGAFAVFTLESLSSSLQTIQVEVFLDNVARDQRYLISSVRIDNRLFTFDRFVSGEVKFVQDDPVSETAMAICAAPESMEVSS